MYNLFKMLTSDWYLYSALSFQVSFTWVTADSANKILSPSEAEGKKIYEKNSGKLSSRNCKIDIMCEEFVSASIQK